MPVQRFAPMTKAFATFDGDAHVTEPPLIWERAVPEQVVDAIEASFNNPTMRQNAARKVDLLQSVRSIELVGANVLPLAPDPEPRKPTVCCKS